MDFFVKTNNASNTKCPKCGKDSFEIVEDKPTNSQYVLNYLRCSSCKTFLAEMPVSNTGVLLDTLHKDMDKLKKILKVS